MDESAPTSKVVFLSQLDIFSELEEDELAALASIADEYGFEDGAVIAYQRDVADKMIVVRSGRLYAFQVDSLGIVRDSHSYNEGDYFEDVWLFDPRTHPATVRGSDDGRVIFIEHSKFTQFLRRYPEALDYLKLSDEAQEAAAGSLFADVGRQIRSLELLPDEIVEYYERRSIWFVLFKLAFPFIALLIWAGLIQYFIGFGNTWANILTILPAVFFILFAVIQFFDWRNDYFVITNKHLVHREYQLLRVKSSVNKVPLDQVQSVEIVKPDLISTILNLGAARITTSAQAGVLMFDHIADPMVVKETINELREQVHAMDAGRTQATMRTALEEHFQSVPAYERIEESGLDGNAGLGDEQRSFWGRIRHAVGARVVDGNVITYRKHPAAFLRRVWWMLLAGLLFFLGMVFVSSLTVALIFLVLCLIDFAWLVWRFEDWRNDTFQVTNRYVIDIDRRPFGFGESRKQAELGNVQNVDALRPNLMANIFNYGNVVIETAGASADITFEMVVNPNRVQSDIFQRREAYRVQQQRQEGEQRRKEYAVLLDVYQQAREQGRIPNRTPVDGS